MTTVKIGKRGKIDDTHTDTRYTTLTSKTSQPGCDDRCSSPRPVPPRRSTTPPSCQGLHHRPPRGSAIYLSFNSSPIPHCPRAYAPSRFHRTSRLQRDKLAPEGRSCLQCYTIPRQYPGCITTTTIPAEYNNSILFSYFSYKFDERNLQISVGKENSIGFFHGFKFIAKFG